MRHRAIQAGVIAVACAPIVLSAALATASVPNVGDATPSSSEACGPDTGTILQTAVSSGASYAIAANGVITSVQLGGSSDQTVHRGFKLARGSARTYTIVGSTDPVTIPSGQVVTQDVRIPAQAGDVLGVYVAEGKTRCARSTGSSADKVVQYLSKNLATGTTATGTSGSAARISVAATVEPDADGDGYGDITQDQCPTQASTVGPCAFTIGSVGAPHGKGKVGRKLRAPHLTGLPPGATETFQWYRRVHTRGHHKTRVIHGATSEAYKVKGKDRGDKVLVQITVSAPTYTSTTVSSKAKRVH